MRKIVAGLALSLAVSLVVFSSNSPDSLAQEDDKPTPQPVEKDMHEFMEYAFEPGYKRLRDAMAFVPENNNQWKAIKGESLTLAEGGNLLLIRAPREDAGDWNRFSAAVRGDGSKLYKAARGKDFDAAKKSYVSMLNNCNRCHDQFAGGKHQLKP
jgi:hypothetical protein